MIIEKDSTFDWINITLDAEEAEAILTALQGRLGLYEQFIVMQEFREALEDFLKGVKGE